ncbi:MAG TPA: NAD(P)/FAD-dependent oxidoreductase [Nitrospirota bacterium]|nr:NAD(P)/FAD-dependent oxidoreductase [Nitrospirota bacterium]
MVDHVYDCIVVGAGPGGLQAAIYLARYNRDVLVLDRSGGRTWHARHIENVLTHRDISGAEIIERGMEQARSFGVHIVQTRVTSIKKEELFTVSATEGEFLSRQVIAASGVTDIIPAIENVLPFLGAGYFTCIDCDGYKTTNKKLVVMGDRLESVSIALAMGRMYTRDITYLPYRYELPETARSVLEEAGIRSVAAEPNRIIGTDAIEALELTNGERIDCEAIMASFGVILNDEYLAGLSLKKDAERFKYVVSRTFESSTAGLYIVGPLNTGQDQVVIAAGEGAVAAMDINKKLLDRDNEAAVMTGAA